MFDYDKIIKRTGVAFRDRKLLLTAFTHSGYANLHKTDSYDRLEFLGDSVLSLSVTEYLLEKNHSADEGYLTRLRAAAVSQASLTEVMNCWDLYDQILTAGTDPRVGKIASDVVEAVIGAVFTENGYAYARDFVYKILQKILSRLMTPEGAPIDYKTQLQETVQETQRAATDTIQYRAIGVGADGTNTVEVIVNGERLATGTGNTKKEAEKDAAHRALIAINEKKKQN